MSGWLKKASPERKRIKCIKPAGSGTVNFPADFVLVIVLVLVLVIEPRPAS
jgi:hypothetical protein